MSDMACGVIIVSTITHDSLFIHLVIELGLVNGRSTTWLPTHVPEGR